MKVYNIPAEAPQPPGFNCENWQADEQAHREALGAWLKEQGYTGRYTGKCARFPVADGYAEYMLADGRGRYGNSFLFHLPYGDAYQDRYVAYLPKKAIVENIQQNERIAALFS